MQSEECFPCIVLPHGTSEKNAKHLSNLTWAIINLKLRTKAGRFYSVCYMQWINNVTFILLLIKQKGVILPGSKSIQLCGFVFLEVWSKWSNIFYNYAYYDFIYVVSFLWRYFYTSDFITALKICHYKLTLNQKLPSSSNWSSGKPIPWMSGVLLKDLMYSQ